MSLHRRWSSSLVTTSLTGALLLEGWLSMSALANDTGARHEAAPDAEFYELFMAPNAAELASARASAPTPLTAR